MSFVVRCSLPCLALILFGSASMQAQATRTWVSGVGDDVNPCSRTAPCKTFAGAISKTVAGGEIDALDPASFGTVTITKSITIDGGGGQAGGILASGTNGLTINAGVNDVVSLRNLTVNGVGTGISGVNALQAGYLHLENVTLSGFANGLNINSASSMQVTLDRVVSRDNTSSALTAGGAGGVKVTARESSFLNTTGGPGVSLGTGTVAIFRNVQSNGNSGAGFVLNSAGSTGQLLLVDSTASANNGAGLQVEGGAGTAVARLSGTSLTFNAGAITIGTGGFVGSYGDNRFTGVITGGTVTTLSKQ